MKSGIVNQSAALFMLLVTMVVSGCSNLKVNEKRGAGAGIVLPKSRMESDSVAVRVAVVELDDHQKSDFESFISTTDEKLPLDVRRRLDDNGMRVSIVPGVNSAALQKLLTPRVLERDWLSDKEADLANANKLEPVFRLASQRHVEKKRGESFSVEVSPIRPESTWRVFVGQHSFPDKAVLAQCQMRITSWPLPDGSVKLEFVPEIHYGQRLSRIGVNNENFAVEQQRDIKELKSLSFEVVVQRGETIVFAPTGQLERLGDLFFNANEQVGGESEIVSTEPSDEVDLAEYFPMLQQQIEDVEAPLEADGIDTAELQGNGRPQPWQRFLMVRVVEVTPPTSL